MPPSDTATRPSVNTSAIPGDDGSTSHLSEPANTTEVSCHSFAIITL